MNYSSCLEIAEEIDSWSENYLYKAFFGNESRFNITVFYKANWKNIDIFLLQNSKTAQRQRHDLRADTIMQMTGEINYLIFLIN